MVCPHHPVKCVTRFVGGFLRVHGIDSPCVCVVTAGKDLLVDAGSEENAQAWETWLDAHAKLASAGGAVAETWK